MVLANIHVRLHRAELARPQLRADFANSLSLRRHSWELNEEAVRELVAPCCGKCRHNHLDRA